MGHEFNAGQFSEVWGNLPVRVRKVIRDFAQYPTERNKCYVVGYLAAANDSGATDADQHSYLTALVGRLRHSEVIRDAVKAGRLSY